MNTYHDKLKTMTTVLNETGPGFCLAKWSQLTLHLQNGHNHSCHHPDTHLIPVNEIIDNPAGLHNTTFKKQIREIMISGGRPSECQYCWNIEDNNKKNNDIIFSDRITKSSQPWSLSIKDEIYQKKATGDINPKYLEVSFSHVCNFKCAYCSPHISSKWMEEISKYGEYPTSTKYNDLEWIKRKNKYPISTKDINPYVDAFWEWWPEIYKNLHTFRITGGEPLLTKNTFKVLDYIIDNPNPTLEFAINSNCVVPEKNFDEFIEKVKIIQSKKLVKRFTLYTSCEAYGNKAEYIRHGMIYDNWLENCKKYLTEIPSGCFGIMSTYNALSVTSYTQFLSNVLELKRTYNNIFRNIIIDIPYLNHPKWLNVSILSDDYKMLYNEQIKYIKDNISYNGFSQTELNKLESIEYLFNSEPSIIDRRDFYKFFNEHDKRRETDFISTFPEMEEFYNLCKNLV